MELPAILQGESRARLFQGIGLGAVAAMVIGFSWGGWVTGGSATKQVSDATNSAVIAALAPVCVDQFMSAEDAGANLIGLKEISSYKRTGFVEDGGWAVTAGSEKPSAGVAKACAVMLNDLESAS